MDFDPQRFASVLVREMADAVIYADAQGVIQFWNAGAERILGFTAVEAVGQTLDIIIPPNLRQRHWDGFNKTMRTGETRYQASDLLKVPAIRKDGRRISVEFTVLPFRDDAGQMTGIAAVMRDVTETFEAMRALRSQLAAGTTGGRAA
jgi:PAS domain S-box-containing protein